MTHAVIHSKTRGSCPRWLHEGLAQWSSGVRIGSNQQKTVAKKLAELSDAAEWPDRQFSYDHALSMVTYLFDQGGFHKLVSLLDLLGEGHDADYGLQRLYGETFGALTHRWSRELTAKTASN